MFVVMQVAGALVAVVLARFWHPTLHSADLVEPEPADAQEPAETRVSAANEQ